MLCYIQKVEVVCIIHLTVFRFYRHGDAKTPNLSSSSSSLTTMETLLYPHADGCILLFPLKATHLLLRPPFIFLVLTEFICMTFFFTLPGKIIILSPAFVQRNQSIYAEISVCYGDLCPLYLFLHPHIPMCCQKTENVVLTKILWQGTTRTSVAFTTLAVS